MCVYHIIINGHIDTSWSDWFDRWSIDHRSDGTSLLTSPPIDQVKLYGVLKKINDLNFTLISVNSSANKKDTVSIVRTEHEI